MKLAIGCDHTALQMKNEIIEYLTEKNYTVEDFGAYYGESSDYPVYGEAVARAVAGGGFDFGILICGTGIGISLAANKVCGIRAAVCSEPYSASMARRHNDANIIAFGARVIDINRAKEITDAFLSAEFEGGRHTARVDMIMGIERKQCD